VTRRPGSARAAVLLAAIGLAGSIGLLLWLGDDTSLPEPVIAPAPSTRDAPASDAEPARDESDASAALLDQAGAGAPAPADSDRGRSAAAADTMPTPQELMRMTNFDRRQFFDRRAARAAGLTEAEIDQVYERWAAAERAIHSRIELDHARGRRVRPGTRSYDADLREFLEDDEFDVALYATGQMNRVHLSEPKEGGRPLAEGLLAGDIIESYDGEPVYRLIDLQLMMKETSAGEYVTVVVRRNGELVEVDVPGRHPLGPKTPRRTPPMAQ